MSNKEKFKETFGQIKATKEVLNKIEGLEVKKSEKQYMKPAIVFAIICVLVLLGRNVDWDFAQHKEEVTLANGKIYYYAAEMEEEENAFSKLTGNEIQLKKEHILVNNDELSDEVIGVHIDENSYYHFQMKDGNEFGTLVEEPQHTSILILQYETSSGGNTGQILKFVGKLKEEDGRIYLYFSSFEKGRDITEDFQDGVAEAKIYWDSGTVYDRVKGTLEFRVEGTLEDYTVDVWFVIE